MVYPNTPMWIKNRIPKDLRPQTKVALRKLLWKEYRKLSPEERKADEKPIREYKMITVTGNQIPEEDTRMYINYPRLMDFRAHYRGLAAFQNHKLLQIRTFLQELQAKGHNRRVSTEDWNTLMELARAELYKIPSRTAVEIDQMLEVKL